MICPDGTNAVTAMAKPAKAGLDLPMAAAKCATNPERVPKVADDIVTGVSLARHLGCSRTNITRLVETGIIPQRPDGNYDQSTCRLRYIEHLRAEYRKSPRAATEQELSRHRARLYAIKVARAEGKLMETAECDAFIEDLAGLVLTKLGGWPARISGNDLCCGGARKPWFSN